MNDVRFNAFMVTLQFLVIRDKKYDKNLLGFLENYREYAALVVNWRVSPSAYASSLCSLHGSVYLPMSVANNMQQMC